MLPLLVIWPLVCRGISGRGRGGGDSLGTCVLSTSRQEVCKPRRHPAEAVCCAPSFVWIFTHRFKTSRVWSVIVDGGREVVDDVVCLTIAVYGYWRRLESV
ncbi:hypothetical protein F4680DRAFT_116215 [Xylaria scruposa]|nr:hypothetical protein F4680DRAFT_116215 [Xylaria scruposa]